MARDATIAARWAVLGQLDRTALRAAWVQAFDAAPPHFLSMAFMRKALIWHEQGQQFGGLGADLRRALKAAAKATAPGHAGPAAPRPGTQLIREWNGRRYIVEATGDGYLLNGERFRSLSAVALHITGTTWSGPRFFGLVKRPRADA